MNDVTARTVHSTEVWFISFISQMTHLKIILYKSKYVCHKILYKNVSIDICSKVIRF